ncbi:hypothetical protein QBC35DRAFT_465781 [Podospora australis]|uniref:NACHT domain-containing protein n=1 Tax=Podospora australis TaxID=1536484 RepID=A0AAN6WP64_9PEZI|nr:hypothetical protein QBC35DRAFT_465781 [Podospora australis]
MSCESGQLGRPGKAVSCCCCLSLTLSTGHFTSAPPGPMDPISALSLVANIIGVISFAGDTISLAAQIHSAGDSRQLTSLKQSGQTLTSATAIVLEQTSKLDPKDASNDEFLRLARSTTRVSDDITQLLTKVRGGDGKSKPSKWKTVQQTSNTVWNQDTLKRLEAELADARANLQLYTTVSIKAKIDSQDVGREEIHARLDARTCALLAAFVPEFDYPRSQTNTIIGNQETAEALAKQRHEELLSSIQGHPRDRDKLPHKLSPLELIAVQRTILSTLWFPPIKDREDMIHDAYKKTFQWIYRDAAETGLHGMTSQSSSRKLRALTGLRRTKDLLKTWSEGKELVMASFYFYYNGSELQKSEIGVMRSLLHQILESNESLIQVAFQERLWYSVGSSGGALAPTAMELKRAFANLMEHFRSTNICLFLMVDGLDEFNADESEMGVLVSTLRDLSKSPLVKLVLSSRPWPVFEERFAGCPRLRLHDLTRPDISLFVNDKLSQYPRFDTLQSTNLDSANALIEEIIDTSSGVFLWVSLVVNSLLLGLTNYDTIDDLRQRFRELPPDLERLFRHMWDRVPYQYRPQASRLLRLVQKGTEGGRSLSLLGLSFAQNNDFEHVLDAQVRPLKQSLVDYKLEVIKGRLLSHCPLVQAPVISMLSGIHRLITLIASRSLPLACSPAPSPLVPRSGPLIGYSFSNSDIYSNSVEEKHRYPKVVFLHRTVYEFISSTAIHRELESLLHPPGAPEFIPEVALLHSALMRIKSFDLADRAEHLKPFWTEVNSGTLNHLVNHCLTIASEAEHASQHAQSRVLYELDRVMSGLARGLRTVIWEHDDLPGESSDYWAAMNWAAMFKATQGRAIEGRWIESGSDGDLIRVAGKYNLTLFVDQAFSSENTRPSSGCRRNLLIWCLGLFRTRDGMNSFFDSTIQPSMAEIVLKHGEDPNGEYDWHDSGSVYTTTVWGAFLGRLLSDTFHFAYQNLHPEDTVTLVDLMVRYGADSKVKLPARNPLRFQSELRTLKQISLAQSSYSINEERLNLVLGKLKTVPPNSIEGRVAKRKGLKKVFSLGYYRERLGRGA